MSLIHLKFAVENDEKESQCLGNHVLGKVAQKPISQVPLPIGAPKEFTEVVNIRGACVADDKIPEASVHPRLGIESQLPTERGSRIQPA